MEVKPGFRDPQKVKKKKKKGLIILQVAEEKDCFFFLHQLKYFLNLILEATTATLEYLLLLLFGGKGP